MSVAINSPAIGSLNNWKKRAASEDEEEMRTENSKKSKYNSWYFTLERETSTSIDEDEESIYTVQGYETEYARDTSDTSTNSCSSSDEDASNHLEFELASEPENNDAFVVTTSSSEPENNVDGLVYCISLGDSDGLADDSDNSRCSTDSDVTKPAKFQNCGMCGKKNNNTQFRFCERCYKMYKEQFPRSRPKRKPRTERMGSSLSITSLESSTHILSQMDSEISTQLTELDSTPGSNQDAEVQSDAHSFKTPNKKKELNLTKDKFSTEEIHVDLQSADSDCSLFQLSQDSGITQNSQDSGIGSSQDWDKVSGDSPNNESRNDSMSSNQTKDKGEKEESQTETSGNIMSSTSSTNNFTEERQMSSSQESGSDWNTSCLFCTVNPRNSGFPHGKTMHVCCCYSCAKKVWNSNGNRCPICKLSVNRIIKAFF